MDLDILLGFVKSNKNARSALKTTTLKNVETNTPYAAQTAKNQTFTYKTKTNTNHSVFSKECPRFHRIESLIKSKTDY
jgi:hypothetical protein